MRDQLGLVLASVESSLASITEASHTSSGRGRPHESNASPIKYENPHQAYGNSTNRSIDSA